MTPQENGRLAMSTARRTSHVWEFFSRRPSSPATKGSSPHASRAHSIFEPCLPAPDCPVLDAALSGRDLNLTFDYGAGCQSTYFQETSIRGQVRGIYYTAYNAFDLRFEDVAIHEESLSGAATGRIDVIDGVQEVTLNVNLTMDGITARGTVATWLSSDLMWLRGTELTATDSEGVGYLITLNEVGVNVGANPTLSPHEGTAQVMLDSSNPGSQMSISFTSETPYSGRVNVQSNSE